METRQRNKARAEARAKTVIRQLIVSHNLNYFWTLTFEREVTTIEEAWLEFGLFKRRVQYHIPEWRFVVVPELQKRGVWHFHLCCNTRVEHATIARLWGQGFVWVQHVREDRAARYMVKYLAKAFSDSETFGSHRYRRSQGLELETVCGAADSIDEAVSACGIEEGRIIWRCEVDNTGGVYAVVGTGGP